VGERASGAPHRFTSAAIRASPAWFSRTRRCADRPPSVTRGAWLHGCSVAGASAAIVAPSSSSASAAPRARGGAHAPRPGPRRCPAAPSACARLWGARATCPVSTGGGTRRVRLVREEGRVVYSQYGREGGARPPGALPPPPRPALTCQRDETCPISTEGCTRRVHFVRKGGGEGSAATPRAQGSCHGGVAARRRASRRAACGARLGVRAGGRVADRALRSSSTRRSSSAPVRRAASRRACPRRRVRAPQG